jgi:hypothetical protein
MSYHNGHGNRTSVEIRLEIHDGSVSAESIYRRPGRSHP